MKNLEKLVVAGITFVAVFTGYGSKVYLDSLGKYECVFNRQTVIADASSGQAFPPVQTAQQTTINYVISGRCDFDFNQLGGYGE